jgi:hypothetical protein
VSKSKAVVPKAKGNTMILACFCKSDYQDERYGKARRVHNRSGKKGKEHIGSCTVCGKENGGYL